VATSLTSFPTSSCMQFSSLRVCYMSIHLILLIVPRVLTKNTTYETHDVTFLNLWFQLFFYGTTAPSGPGPSHCRGFSITPRHTTFGRTLLDEWSARRRDLYLTTHDTHKRQTSKHPAGFEPTIPASERPQTHALDHAATGIGLQLS
jgi:hypothetical protein